MAIDDLSAEFGEIRAGFGHLKEHIQASELRLKEQIATSEEKASRYRHSMREDIAEIKEGMVSVREQVNGMLPQVKDSAERWQRHDGASTLRKTIVATAAGLAGAVVSTIGGYLYKLIPFAGVKLPGP